MALPPKACFMHYSSEIQIIDLLARREAEFLRVWACEQEISRLLEGAAFPFPPTTTLPSHARGPRKKLKVGLTPTPQPAQADPGAGPLQLRRLRSPENACRLTYTFKGEEFSSFSTDQEFISKLHRLRCADFKLRRVEAGCYRSIEDFAMTEILWQTDQP